MNAAVKLAALAVAAVLLLTACGQAGGLYLPGRSPQEQKREQQKQTQPAPPPAP